MIQSMTGYGKAELNLNNANFTIEVRSLNSKQIDANVKMSSVYREHELGLRKLLADKLKRGKVELSIWKESSEASVKYQLNTDLIKEYYLQVEGMTNMLNLNVKDIMPSLLKMPDVLIKGEQKPDENEWEQIEVAVHTAINNLVQFRLDEGKKLEADVRDRISKIGTLLTAIAPYAAQRIEKVKGSLAAKLSEIENKNLDANRFEQELIYYLEKQDITEEQVRLDAHLNYFLETIEQGSPNGKKLGFIGQEIGREINTIGSKSSDAEMQKLVVQMKDELEKIKEQLLNIL